MENPDLVLQETGSRLTYSRLNYVPSGDTLRRDTISSVIIWKHKILNTKPESEENINYYLIFH